MHPDETPPPDYDFIMNPAPPAKKNLLGGGKNPKQRILVVVAGGFVLLILFTLIFNLIFSGGNGNIDRLVGLVQAQNEIIRISELGEKKATSADTKQFAATVKLSTTSSQKELITYLTKQDRKLKPQELAAAKNIKTDDLLTKAQQANQFDEVFTETMQTQLESYQQNIQEAYNASGSQSEKATLQTFYDRVRVLTTVNNTTQ